MAKKGNEQVMEFEDEDEEIEDYIPEEDEELNEILDGIDEIDIDDDDEDKNEEEDDVSSNLDLTKIKVNVKYKDLVNVLKIFSKSNYITLICEKGSDTGLFVGSTTSMSIYIQYPIKLTEKSDGNAIIPIMNASEFIISIGELSGSGVVAIDFDTETISVIGKTGRVFIKAQIDDKFSKVCNFTTNRIRKGIVVDGDTISTISSNGVKQKCRNSVTFSVKELKELIKNSKKLGSTFHYFNFKKSSPTYKHAKRIEDFSKKKTGVIKSIVLEDNSMSDDIVVKFGDLIHDVVSIIPSKEVSLYISDETSPVIFASPEKDFILTIRPQD